MARPSRSSQSSSPLPSWFVAEKLGLDDARHKDFGAQIIQALEKISPELLPKMIHHPFAKEIARGADSYTKLLDRARHGKSDEERAGAIDAIGEIASRESANEEVIGALQKILGEAKSELVASMAARALASANDAAFLEHQHNLLLSDKPTEMRIAVKLLGFGRYARAVPALLDVLKVENAVVAETIIWTLGEIGDEAAVPKLHALLTQFGMTEEVLEALGKIGSRASIVRITPLLLEGSEDQRELAAEALAKIARRNHGSFGDPGLDQSMRAVLEKVIDEDQSRVARFYAIVAYSLIGGHLEPKRILAALGGKLSDKELASVEAVLLPGRSASALKGGKPKGKRGV
jgi:HEAT repeat protein